MRAAVLIPVYNHEAGVGEAADFLALHSDGRRKGTLHNGSHRQGFLFVNVRRLGLAGSLTR